jgi:cyclopropane fatty-acyl-phospholipid synthase-like methyltransferase
MIQAYYYFTVWRNYKFLLHGLSIPQGQLLELGSSTAQISLRLAIKYKLSPTLVDTSLLALTQAYQNFRVKLITPNLLHKDVKDFRINKQFDVVHSHGLLEHFSGETRKKVFKTHVEHTRRGGWLICWVPSPDLFYHIKRWYLENTGQWIFGFEKPINTKDFVNLFANEKLIIRKIRRTPGWSGIVAQRH